MGVLYKLGHRSSLLRPIKQRNHTHSSVSSNGLVKYLIHSFVCYMFQHYTYCKINHNGYKLFSTFFPPSRSVWKWFGWVTVILLTGTGGCTVVVVRQQQSPGAQHWMKNWVKWSIFSVTRLEPSLRTSWPSTSAPSTEILTVRRTQGATNVSCTEGTSLVPKMM